LHGRVDQLRLKKALEDLVRPHFYERPEDRIRDVAVLINDLAEFSNDVAGWAVREWRLRWDRRPTSAALRQLCMNRRHELMAEVNARRPPEPEPYQTTEITPEERDKRAAVLERVAKASGFVQTQHGQWTLPAAEKDKPKRVPHWSEGAAPDDPRWAMLRKARAEAGL
jgi:hypothetical protein